MSVYHLVTLKVLDKETFLVYAEKAKPLASKFGGTYLAAGRPAGSLEGEGITDPVVLTRWDSREQLEHFWNSPEYKALRKKREGAVIVNSTIIEE